MDRVEGAWGVGLRLLGTVVLVGLWGCAWLRPAVPPPREAPLVWLQAHETLGIQVTYRFHPAPPAPPLEVHLRYQDAQHLTLGVLTLTGWPLWILQVAPEGIRLQGQGLPGWGPLEESLTPQDWAWVAASLVPYAYPPSWLPPVWKTAGAHWMLEGTSPDGSRRLRIWIEGRWGNLLKKEWTWMTPRGEQVLRLRFQGEHPLPGGGWFPQRVILQARGPLVGARLLGTLEVQEVHSLGAL